MEFQLLLESDVSTHFSFQLLQETFIDHCLVWATTWCTDQILMIPTHLVEEHVFNVLVSRVDNWGCSLFFPFHST